MPPQKWGTLYSFLNCLKDVSKAALHHLYLGKRGKKTEGFWCEIHWQFLMHTWSCGHERSYFYNGLEKIAA